MINEEIRKKLIEAGYADTPLYENQSYDNSIIGVDEDGKVVYDYDKMVAEYNKDEGYEPDDTAGYEWVDYNTIRATPYGGPTAPVVISDVSYLDEEDNEGYQYMNMITGEPYKKEIVFKL